MSVNRFSAYIACSCAAGWLGSVVVAQMPPCGWQMVTPGPEGYVYSLAAHDEGGGVSLFVGGNFASAGGIATGRLARWNGDAWSAVGGTVFNTGVMFTLFSHDDGSGPALYVGSSMQPAPLSSGVTRWDGSAWAAPGTGLSGIVGTFAVHQGELYAGGTFWLPAYGEHGPRNIARWSGLAWEPVGGGTNNEVSSLLSYDDGGGPMLILSGFFTSPSPSVAGWRDTGWIDLRGSWDSLRGSFVRFDDGSGEALYLAGFGQRGGAPTAGVLKWEASDWIPVGVTDTGPTSAVVWDNGSGAALYIGGGFATVNGAPMSYVANWDGGTWSGTGAEVLASGIVVDLAVFDDGNGQALYAGGGFASSTRFLARYSRCGDTCYANCTKTTTEPILTIDDFTCFINAFAAASALPHEQQIDHYANCDGSTAAPVLTVDDFTCFINAFAAGCD